MKLVLGIFHVPDDDDLVQDAITEEDIESLDASLANLDNGVEES